MEWENIFLAPPNFSGENYEIWSVRMKTHLLGLDLWDAVSAGKEVAAKETAAGMKVEVAETAKKQISESILPSPPKFSGKNYEAWSVRMKTYLQALELWDAVSAGKEVAAKETAAGVKVEAAEPAKKQISEIDKSRALCILQNSVSEAIFKKIMACTTAKQAWVQLRDEFAMTDKTRIRTLFRLWREFENLMMGEEESVRAYADRVKDVANKIRLCGDDTYPERRVVEKIVYTLPEKFDIIITALATSRNDIADISLSELLDALYSFEQRRANRQKARFEEAMVAKDKGKAKKGQF
ncbi:hypothetical protein CCACVL1_31062 [Corchorus capsularis]|uniref:DUF4219 domain-containing protein n=1 Tax=Corchorus capsularis TaxID=210143 RepID=A0A1R3FU38_COCAP|nr:hypothetical protein CCACVL1_31062 [Corchorus capsularis]